MNHRLHVEPPAPPPFWQSEPLVETSTHVFESPANLVSIVILFGIGCFILALLATWIRNRWRFDIRAEERQLRNILVQHPRIGPDAVWLSASAIKKRLDGTDLDDRTVRTIERLKKIEAHRFDPKRVE